MKLPDTPFLQHQPSQGEKRCRNRSWEVLKYAIHVLTYVRVLCNVFNQRIFFHYSQCYVAELCANLYLKCAHMQIAGSSKIFIISILKTIQSLKILFQNGNGSLEFRNVLRYSCSILSCFLFTFVLMCTQQNEIAI